jgi:hypothetical protein
MTCMHQLKRREAALLKVSWLPLPSWSSIAVAMAAVVISCSGCSGKKRDFAETTAISDDGTKLPSPGDVAESANAPRQVDDGASSSGPQSGSESAALPGSLVGPSDAGSNQSVLPTSMNGCGDACSGECAPGAVQCASLTQRIECGIDALWGAPVTCENLCLDGACAGECSPGATECVSTTRFRSCAELGSWSEPSDCANACVGAACGGECRPGQTRCVSNTSVQTCDDAGQWAQTTGCQSACAGEACTGECAPGATRCSSETQLQTCNQQGQFQAPAACQFACVNGSCGGECTPGSGRCNPANGVPQFCSSTGIWQSQAPCQFVCAGSGSCSGECTPGSRRCSPASGVPQLCGGAGFWQNQGPCDFICTNGTCGGDCVPGSRRCDPASGAPQLCSNAATWQNQAACARGCQNGSCTPQLGPGLACASASDCASGFCVDGVCCQSQCGGVCAQCQAGTGACITPATDTDCDPVICNSNECQVSSGNITSNLCRSRGQCKDQSDCNFSGFDRGTPCDTAGSDFKICDGGGTCVEPTVRCAGVNGRTVGEDNVCCARWNSASGATSEAYEPRTSCISTSINPSTGVAQTQISCDSNDDCRAGAICCLTSASGNSFVQCLPTSQCNQEQQFVSRYGVCSSPSGFSNTCPAGFVCQNPNARNFLDGWDFCDAP